MEAGKHQEAVLQYEKAVKGQPKDARMWKALGGALHMLSRNKPIGEAFPLEQRAMESFQESALLIPIDAEAHYGLGRSTARLEQMHFLLQPAAPDNPFRPLPHFQKALELRPNGILYRYALVRYLYRTADIRAFRHHIQELVRIYPPTYSNLRREPFWSESLEEVIQEGLIRAVEEGILPRAALMALADMMERNNNVHEALRYYTSALEHRPHQNTPANQIHLGRMYLKAGEYKPAEDAFMRGLLAGKSRETDLRRVLAAYKAHYHMEAFFSFFDAADRSIPFSLEARLIKAEALIEAKAFPEARLLLKLLNRQRPTARAYYLLYTIAVEQKDANLAETAIQKTTVLEPKNSRYHQLFSRVLLQAGKLDMAERAATRAIDNAHKPSHGLFHYRATIRIRLNDFNGALSDWKTGMSLAAKRAAYYAHAADALVQLARFDEALDYAAKAAALEPENQQLQLRYTRLKEQLKDP